MSTSPKYSHLRSLLRQFADNDRGNIAVLFSIAVLPIITFVGAAVDYTRVSTARTTMQSALDSAALMVSKDLSSGAIKTADINAQAQAYFTALYTNKDAYGVNVVATYTAKDSQGKSTVSVTGSGSINTEFMKVAGYPKLDFNTASTTTWGGTRMRVAMALDVTGSMNDDGKLPAMKKAATDLVATLKGLAKSKEDVYISVVPFAQMVNVGVENKAANWLNWDELGSCSSSDWRYASYFSRFNTKTGCENDRTYSVSRTWTPTSNKTNWKGCVTDRDQPYDTTKDAPTTNDTDFPAAFYKDNGNEICPDQILPMTSIFADATPVTKKINDLVAAGGTNQPIGIQMAWQTLQPDGAFNAPSKEPDYKYTDVMIVLSDGMNTIDRWYGNGSAYSSDVDARQTILCQNITDKQKATMTQDYRVYTIQVNTTGDPESAVLKACASKNGGFFSTKTADEIARAFNAIGTSLSQLRVSQ